MLLDAKLMKKDASVNNVQTIVMNVFGMNQNCFNVKYAKMAFMKKKDIVYKIVAHNFILTQIKRNAFVVMIDVLTV